MAPGDIVVKQIRAVPHPVLVPPPVITNAFAPTNDYLVVDLSGGPVGHELPGQLPLDAVPARRLD